MPRDESINKVLIIGSGPIQIGQAAEFDYSGSQACKSLREEGIETVLVNSNPATIQTDMEMADRVYVEPLTPEIVAKIIEKEKPDAVLPTMGGQTGLNVATGLAEIGALEGVRVIGSSIETIRNVEDRDLFDSFMKRLNEPVPAARAVNSVEEALEAVDEIGYPVIVRPAFTLGGTGGGVAHNRDELIEIATRGLEMSFINQVLIDQSVLGWKEFEYEVMRDRNDTCIIVCNMENIDPMGIHTGESVVVAPAQTLSDEDNQRLRDAAIKIIRALRIEGGCNIQFAVHPETGEYKVIEVNPRVSRSSALASKATGYPIAKIAAKIAVGMTLDEIENDITKETPASFEPSIDYIVTKIPRWPFDKFRGISREIGVQMKSTGEVMAIGRTLEESLNKAIRSLDIGADGFMEIPYTRKDLENPTDLRLFQIYTALKDGMGIDEIHELTGIDPFFLEKIWNIVNFESSLTRESLRDPRVLLKAKRMGFSDSRLASITGLSESEIRSLRLKNNIKPVYKMVDTCAAEFEAKTPYYYGCYDLEDEVEVSDRKKVLIIGSGPIRIGQGIEFDYCCVHAAMALTEDGYETIMVNNNPETVSTDYDISDKLYFEPLTLEDVLAVIDKEKPEGVVVQFGGQTSINLAVPLAEEGVRILGTPHESIDRVEDRERFTRVLDKLGIPQAPYGIAKSFEDAREVAERIGYPVLVRPSYVLGGRAMEIVYDERELEEYMKEAVRVSPEHPILVDKFLEDAIEVDVDALSDGTGVYIGGIMEHIEEAGVHSGDSACVIPPQSIPQEIIETIKDYTRKLALELDVVGLINIQYAVKPDSEPAVYILEANPRASRTVPFVSKATGVPLAKIAARLMMGAKLSDLGLTEEKEIDHVAVKESVFPFIKLPGADSVLGPEMKSTGEAMGIDENFGIAYYKSQLSASMDLLTEGKVFISVRDQDKDKIADIVKKASDLGFKIMATRGTARAISDIADIEVVRKVSQGSPNIRDSILNGEVGLIINTPSGKQSADDGYLIRRMAVELGIPYVTTLAGARAALNAIEAVRLGRITVKSLDEYHGM
ncbi:carbamoyl-phosphate synthase large subunit [Methanothermobacter marburgensis]|uniref:Carbamoyl phosphate synthase large chain n=1 Tax=Methanothermobacter marburgensis (strain ATCC BAA-927 / DSM 2133 / JCM 14651 / NBRC 100331 / OCM 82 / Marburg) TaxID=79929 RepID=D9PXL8_METTM|nr:carbamoyl-phosphate synthase large subunit [Methanothermobacter marburgensis]ADL58966.1 carbamoyl-phosphate synthase, large subunit [Methanothermobacter marburgensis str. Marburg]WBF09503.1 carbamoyl-phosphate synthase large subunit [Methanothermobacter marburgensis]